MLLPVRHRYAAVLAVIALVILGAGLLLKPKPRSHGKDREAVTRDELENLQQLVRRNSLRNLSSNFTSVAEDAAASVVVLQPWNVNGVVVPELGFIVAKRLDALPREAMIGNARMPAIGGQWIPGMPLFIGRLPAEEAVTPARLAKGNPDEGEWVIVVAETAHGKTLVSPGLFNGEVQANCGPFVQQRILTTIPLTNAHVGGGVFDLAGALHGIVVACDDGPAVLPLSEVTRAVGSARSPMGAVLGSYGTQLMDVHGGEERLTIVREVWDNWPADVAGLLPGDQVLSIDGNAVDSRDTANALLQSQVQAQHTLELRRSGRKIQAKLSPLDLNNVAVPGIVVDPGAGVAVLRVAAGSSAEKAGFRTADRLLTVDGRTATPEAVTKLLGGISAEREADVVVRRPGRRVFVRVQR